MHYVSKHIKISDIMGKTADLSDIDKHRIFMPLRLETLISEAACLVSFSAALVESTCRKWFMHSETTSFQSAHTGKEQRLLCIIRLDRKTAIAENNNIYNSGNPNTIPQYIVPFSLFHVGLRSRWPKHDPVLTINEKQQHMQRTHGHRIRVVELWKTVAWSSDCECLPLHRRGVWLHQFLIEILALRCTVGLKKTCGNYIICIGDDFMEQIRIHNLHWTIPDICVLPEHRCKPGTQNEDNNVSGGFFHLLTWQYSSHVIRFESSGSVFRSILMRFEWYCGLKKSPEMNQ